MAEQYICTAETCGKKVTATKNMRYRTHKRPDGQACPNSSVEIPQREIDAGPVKADADPGVPEEGRDYAICPECGRKVKLTALGYFEPHDKTLKGGDRCGTGGVRYTNLMGKKEDLPLPGDVIPEKGVLGAQIPEVSNQREIERGAETPGDATGSSPATPAAPLMLEAGTSTDTETSGTGSNQAPPDPGAPSADSAHLKLIEQELKGVLQFVINQPTPWEESPESEPTPEDLLKLIFGGESGPSGISQPGSPVSQPDEVPVKGEMTERAKEIAARIKEIFYAYQNRKTTDNRSAQTTLGPSEIGTPCDRRLAMSLMDIPPVNPGGDGWAAFVGTWLHEGMAAVFKWADGGTGRFGVEVPVTLPSEEVPRGTTDMIDRVLFILVDWKGMGKYSLEALKAANEMPEHYRVQAHSYGLGATLQGEKIKEVVLVGLPRAGRSLDEMWVIVEKYDKKIALDALARVKKIRKEAFEKGQGPHSKLEVAATFDVATKYECTYCPFHLKGDKVMTKGCPGA